ncbi:N-acetylmuramoyl-L-alanine amidase family protein [Selenomonas ruminantium]|uniref:N-acetylmuramoyl-L-alanine amidase n=1 Tax=Selenomonas ruminantium TaxID=971 RepID=A0A1I0V5J3_SELRU|nr:N-acetylmuramoyl-L-alanine amidase [Selenomonas ruminantium]SFA71327.1 N-acetylmuramoyl-L-alanine amidase [Selenomonas ruminantium]
MRVFLNPGHAPCGCPDPGAVNSGTGLRECDVAKNIADLVEKYLTKVGVSVSGNLQSDDLFEVVSSSNNLDADVFVSIHCNAFNGVAQGTEVWHYHTSKYGKQLAECIQRQIVGAMGTVDRGVKGAEPGRNGLYVLTNTDAVSVLVETAFIDNAEDEVLLRTKQVEFARAIARGITDFEQETLNR